MLHTASEWFDKTTAKLPLKIIMRIANGLKKASCSQEKQTGKHGTYLHEDDTSPQQMR